MAEYLTNMSQLLNNYNYAIHKCSDQRTADWPFISPFTAFGIVVFYFWFVLKAGPAFMKHRQPYHCDRIIQFYNLFQIISTGCMAIAGVKNYLNGKISWVCPRLDFSQDDTAVSIAAQTYIYYLLKILDLSDTVFFVLRKKDSQITFLHIYHHGVMIFFSWLAHRYYPGGVFTYVGYMNCLVHSVMYFYYFISNLNSKYRRNIWWKKYITQLQLFQFASVTLHCIVIILQPTCDTPKFLAYIVLLQSLGFIRMFWEYYKKSYGIKRQNTVKLD